MSNPGSYTDPLDAAFGDEKESAAPQAGREPVYLAGLNKEQREVVRTVDGPVLVLAGAGTVRSSPDADGGASV